MSERRLPGMGDRFSRKNIKKFAYMQNILYLCGLIEKNTGKNTIL